MSYHRIDQYLLLGDWITATNPVLLEHENVSCVLSVCYAIPPRQRVQGITYKHVDVQDALHANIRQHFHPLCKWIKRAVDRKKHVLVHCQQGISRSPTIVCAFLMWSQRIPASLALGVVRFKRKHVRPNEEFLDQLEQFGMELERGYRLQSVRVQRRKIWSILLAVLQPELVQLILSY